MEPFHRPNVCAFADVVGFFFLFLAKQQEVTEATLGEMVREDEPVGLLRCPMNQLNGPVIDIEAGASLCISTVKT